MNTIRKLCQSDATGTVRLDLPVGAPHRRIEVVVVWQEVDEEEAHPSGEAREQKRAALEALAGALADDPVCKPEQPVLEMRLPID